MVMVDVMMDVMVDHALLLYRNAMRDGLRALRRTRAAYPYSRRCLNFLPSSDSATMRVCHFTLSTRTRPIVVECPSTIHDRRKMSVCMRIIEAMALLIPYFDPASIPKGLPRPSQRLWHRNFG